MCHKEKKHLECEYMNMSKFMPNTLYIPHFVLMRDPSSAAAPPNLSPQIKGLMMIYCISSMWKCAICMQSRIYNVETFVQVNL